MMKWLTSIITVIDDKGKLYKLWCSGGMNKDDPDNQKDNGENTLVVFFKDYYAFFINLSSVKACVIFTYIVYVIFSGWAISNLKEGLEYKHFARYDSYTLNYYKANENHFNEFSFGMSVSLIFNVNILPYKCFDFTLFPS